MLSEKTAALLNQILLAFCTEYFKMWQRVISCILSPIIAFFQILRLLISDFFTKQYVTQPFYLQIYLVYENQANPLAFYKTFTNMNLHLLLIHYHLTSNHCFDIGKLQLHQNEIQTALKRTNHSLLILTWRIKNYNSCFLLISCYTKFEFPHCCQKCTPQSETSAQKLATVFQQKQLMSLLFSASLMQISDYGLEI